MDRDLVEPPEPTLLEEARARLFGFTGGGDEEDQPTFAAALDEYVALVSRGLTDTIRIPRFDRAVARVTVTIDGNPGAVDDHWAPESGTS